MGLLRKLTERLETRVLVIDDDGGYITRHDAPMRTDGWSDEYGHDPLDMSDMTDQDIEGAEKIGALLAEAREGGDRAKAIHELLQIMGSALPAAGVEISREA